MNNQVRRLEKALPITEHNWPSDTKPLVSVFNWTYNQKEFIRKSIDSILMQVTDFPVEIIIHDDASNDGTAEIIKEYEARYPLLFRNILQTVNQWSQGKSVMTPLFEEAHGKYIALTHGDDYWTDPLKLQKQINFLDENPEYVLSFHKVKVLKPNGELVDDCFSVVPENYETQETLAKLGNYIHTPSVVFRNIITELPVEFTLSPIGDYFLYLLLTDHGKINYLQNEMAVYRFGVGVMTAKKYLNSSYMHLKLYACVLSAINSTEIKKIILTRFICLADSTQEINESELDNKKLAISKSIKDLGLIVIIKIKAFLRRNLIRLKSK